MNVSSYKDLADLYQPKIEECKMLLQSLDEKITVTRSRLKDTDQTPNQMTTSKIVTLVVGVFVAIAVIVVSAISVGMPILLPTVIGAGSISVMLFVAVRPEKNPVKKSLTDAEQATYVEQITDMDNLKRHIDKAKKTLDVFKQTFEREPNLLLKEGDSQIIARYEKWVRENPVLVRQAGKAALLSGLKSANVAFASCNTLEEAMSRQDLIITVSKLQLSSNNPMILPREIGKFMALTHLDASGCGLMRLPDEIGECKALKELNVSNNQLCDLPEQMHQCPLECIHLQGNCLYGAAVEGLKLALPKVKIII